MTDPLISRAKAHIVERGEAADLVTRLVRRIENVERPPFAIGSINWAGLSKLVEECGEVIQVCGKIIATGGDTEHWEGADLAERLEAELGDLLAACEFVVDKNNLDGEAILTCRDAKLDIFEEWHTNQLEADRDRST